MPFHIDIINVDDDQTSLALRSVLECIGCRVTLHQATTARHLVDLLSGKVPIASEFLMLMCHGIPDGLCLPVLEPQLEAQQPYHRVIRPSQFGEFVHLPGKLVLNTGCALGTPDYGGAFLLGRCDTYIGAMACPSGEAALYYALNFCYELVRGKSVAQAHAAAAVADDDRRMFVLYSQTL